MATRIAWLLNLDADLELQDPATYRDTALPAERLLELQSRVFDLVGPDDVVLDAGAVTDVDLVQAFCPTPTALARIEALALSPPDAPSLSVLCRVNHRRFCADVGQALPYAAFIDDLLVLEQHIAQPSPSGTYVIKRAYSFAGRDQRRVHDGVLDASTRGFCERSFRRKEGVQVEPWVERLADYSKHGYITREGVLSIGTTREQRIDPMGRFQHMLPNAITITDFENTTLTEQVTLVGNALHAAGYFGPFGIDAFRYKLPDGAVALNPRCEINARFTMGYPRDLLLRALTR